MLVANAIKGYKKQEFNIIEEFAGLSPRRKSRLCDSLYVENRIAFQKSVRLLWPQANERDIKKIYNFLVLLKHSSRTHH
ncbi:MAG: hypothetical protein KTR28_02385 [Micavibrio sp.]|nr:hypothetical protein [Micavibrio sp.]